MPIAVFKPTTPAPVFQPAIAPTKPSPPTTSQADASANSERGPATKERLLDLAAELFAMRGVKDVSVRELCERAGTNVAAVNYHFGGKDKLHAAALEHARLLAIENEPQPADGDAISPRPATPTQKLQRHLETMLARAFDSGPAGWYMQMVLREMVQPTEQLGSVVADSVAPHHRRLEAIIGRVLDTDPDTDRVKDAAAIAIAATVYHHACRTLIQRTRDEFVYDAKSAERLAQTITAMVTGLA